MKILVINNIRGEVNYMENIKIFACPTAEDFTKKICKILELPLSEMSFTKFKNDNTFVQLKESVREQDVYIVQTTMPPVNERVMELLIAIDALKRASAARINVILPYYIYSRSDKKDQPRICVTAKLFAELLEAAGATRVISCDLHNPSIQVYFNKINCDRLSAQGVLQDFFAKKKLKDIVVVATDAGSSKKAYKYSEYFKCPIALIDKRREGNDDRAIATSVIGKIKGMNCLIFDDEVDTAGSLIETARILEREGAKSIYAGCTHGILSANAIERINNSKIKELVITDTVPLGDKKSEKIKIVSITPLFAEVIKRLNEKKTLGDLFLY